MIHLTTLLIYFSILLGCLVSESTASWTAVQNSALQPCLQPAISVIALNEQAAFVAVLGAITDADPKPVTSFTAPQSSVWAYASPAPVLLFTAGTPHLYSLPVCGIFGSSPVVLFPDWFLDFQQALFLTLSAETLALAPCSNVGNLSSVGGCSVPGNWMLWKLEGSLTDSAAFKPTPFGQMWPAQTKTKNVWRSTCSSPDQATVYMVFQDYGNYISDMGAFQFLAMDMKTGIVSELGSAAPLSQADTVKNYGFTTPFSYNASLYGLCSGYQTAVGPVLYFVQFHPNASTLGSTTVLYTFPPYITSVLAANLNLTSGVIDFLYPPSLHNGGSASFDISSLSLIASTSNLGLLSSNSIEVYPFNFVYNPWF